VDNKLTGRSLSADKLSDAQGTNNPNLICGGTDVMGSELTVTTWEQFSGSNRWVCENVSLVLDSS